MKLKFPEGVTHFDVESKDLLSNIADGWHVWNFKEQKWKKVIGDVKVKFLELIQELYKELDENEPPNVNCTHLSLKSATFYEIDHFHLNGIVFEANQTSKLNFSSGEELEKFIHDEKIWPIKKDIHELKPQNPTAKDILKAAQGHLEDRASTYDSPEGERSMQATVEVFTAVKGGNSDMLTEEDGWLFMLLLKAVRSQKGNYKADNYEDGTNYFALMGEAAAKERG